MKTASTLLSALFVLSFFGAVSAQPQPQLTSSLSNDQLTVSWPDTGWTLATTSNLTTGGPITQWATVSGSVSTNAITVAPAAGSAFYALRNFSTQTLTVDNGGGTGNYTTGTVVHIDADAAPSGQVFDQWAGGKGFIEDIYSTNTTVLMPGFDLQLFATYRDAANTGIQDLDAIRQDVKDNPATTAENMASRRAALYRWWKLLWHQGYDMTPFDSTAQSIVFRDNSDPVAMAAITPGYAVLEEIQTNGTRIAEVSGTPEPSTTQTDWPVYHGTNGHQTGFSADTGPSEGALAWRYPVGHKWYATPTVRDGRVYAAGGGLDVIGYCLDEVTGEVIWNSRQFKYKIYGSVGSKWAPVVSGDRVMIWTGYYEPNEIRVFNKNTGAAILSLPAGDTAGGDSAEPAVYMNQRWNVILADARTGQGIWKFFSGGLLSGDPVLDGDKVFVSRLSGQVYQLGTTNATPIWSRTITSGVRGKPGLGEGKLFVGSTNRTLYALDKSDGRILWSYQADEIENKAYQYFSGATESNGRVYVGAASRMLYCLNATSGALIWKHTLSDWVRSKPVVVGSTVYVATLDSQVYALEDTGSSASERWKKQVGKHGFTSDLVGNSNGILASGQDVVLYSLSPETGYIQWRHGLLDQIWADGEMHAAEVIGGQYMSSPTIVDGIATIGGPDGFARAFNTDTGELLWRYETSGQVKATVTIGGNLAFIPQTSGHNDFHAVNRLTGEPVWKSDAFGWVFPGVGYAPAYDTDGNPSNDVARIYVAGVSGKVFGADPATGAIAWISTNSSGGLYPGPATDDTRFYTGGHDGYYRAWNQDDGHVEWSVMTGTGTSGNPDSAGMVLWKGHLYLQKLGKEIVAVDAADGSIDWSWVSPSGYLQNGTVATFDNKIFGSAFTGTELPYRSIIYAFDDVENGSHALWNYSAGGGGGGLTGPVGAPGKLIFGSSGGVFMTCLDPDTGALKWRCYTGGAMEEGVPAVYDNKVYFLSRNGYFNAVK